VVKIVDFSVHQIRDYTQSGFTSVDERQCIAILEYYEGIPVTKYINDNFEKITNDQFRDFCCQIMNGIKCLHEENIWHRNINPDCFVLELPNTKAAPKIKTLTKNATKSDMSSAVVVASPGEFYMILACLLYLYLCCFGG
jgi:serine/threonine protein kinase